MTSDRERVRKAITKAFDEMREREAEPFANFPYLVDPAVSFEAGDYVVTVRPRVSTNGYILNKLKEL